MSIVLPVLDGITATTMMRKREYRGFIVPMASNVTGEDVCVYQNYGTCSVFSAAMMVLQYSRHARYARKAS